MPEYVDNASTIFIPIFAAMIGLVFVLFIIALAKIVNKVTCTLIIFVSLGLYNEFIINIWHYFLGGRADKGYIDKDCYYIAYGSDYIEVSRGLFMFDLWYIRISKIFLCFSILLLASLIIYKKYIQKINKTRPS